MGEVFQGFLTIWLVIGSGWLCAHLGVFDVTVQRSLSKSAFYVGLPALLFTALQKAELARIFSLNVVVSVIAIAITLASYLVISRLLWKPSPGHQVIGGFASCYVNANNMGVPIAAYVLGDTSWVAPILMIQILFLQPVGLFILDSEVAKRSGRPPSWRCNLTIPLRNPMTIAVVAGLVVNVIGITVPQVLAQPLVLAAGLGVPAMLLAFGVSLRLGPLPGRGNTAETILVTGLKVLIQPVIAFVLARYLFALDPSATLAVTVLGGLPTAQNVFIFAMRGEESISLARDTIFISSVAAIPAVTAMAALVHLG